MIKAALRIASVFLLGLFASCTTSNVQIIPEATDLAQLGAAGNGLLLVQIADTTPYGVNFPANQLTLAPKDVNESDESKFPRLEAAEAPGDSTTFFYSVLPANDYSLSSLRAFYQLGESYFSKFYPAGIDLGTFSIEPGKVTDLGTLIVYIRRTGDDYFLKTVRAESGSRAASLFREALPDLAVKIENPDSPLTWHSDGHDSDRRSEYINAVNRQTVFADPYVDEAVGIVIFPSRLGVVVQRNEDREWTIDGIPSDEELRLVTRIDSQDVVITEFDEIYRRANRGDSWERIPALPGAGDLRYVGKHSSAVYYAVRQESDRVTLWTAPSLEGAWDNVATIKPVLGFFETLDNSFFSVDQSIKGVGYVTVGDHLYLILKKEVYRFDPETATYEQLDLPKVDSIQFRNGIITLRADGFLSKNSVSFDLGATWQRFSGKLRPRLDSADNRRPAPADVQYVKFQGHPIFLDSQTAFAILRPRESDGDPILIVTNDRGKVWRPAVATALPSGCGQLILASESELLLACYLSGELYRSTDGGSTWIIERESSES